MFDGASGITRGTIFTGVLLTLIFPAGATSAWSPPIRVGLFGESSANRIAGNRTSPPCGDLVMVPWSGQLLHALPEDG